MYGDLGCMSLWRNLQCMLQRGRLLKVSYFFMIFTRLKKVPILDSYKLVAIQLWLHLMHNLLDCDMQDHI